ncbi:MAG: hypothetical protein JWO44_1037 [Bacteroidetes bacterium]|nr:hypothetical protein [Bacteroidota bacterium]
MQMQTLLRILIFLPLLIVGCNNASSDKSAEEKTAEAVPESEQVISTVHDFLAWYKTNYKSVNGFDLVPRTENDSSQYRVSMEECGKMIEKLRASGFFTKNALDGLQAYFVQCDENMLKAKQNDGPPEGLDGDLVLCTQEIEESLSKIEAAEYKDISIDGTSAKVTVQLIYDLPVKLQKEGDAWKIAKICRIGS